MQSLKKIHAWAQMKVLLWQKVISLVTMATNVDRKLFIIVFIFLSGTDHSLKISPNSKSVRAGALWEIFSSPKPKAHG